MNSGLFRFDRPAAFFGRSSTILTVLVGLGACATPTSPPQVTDAPAVIAQAQKQMESAPPAVKTLKRKIAIGRFSNETLYGKALLTGDQLDPLGKQTSDMLSARLVESGRFLVFERPDLRLLQSEQALTGVKTNLVGVDTLIVGSLTEFGRSTEGQSGFLSNTKRQTARAKVEIRLVDTKTGHVFFSTTGSGQASVEQGTVMGFGDRAAYDSTLNDRAIGAAISDVLNSLINKLEARPWQSDVLKADGGRVFISGGTRQGLKVGDRLEVLRHGETVRSGQTGMDIELPPTPVASIQIESFFGSDQTNEGSVASIVSGKIPPGDTSQLYVGEER